MIIQENFDLLLRPVIQHQFDVGMNMVPSMRDTLFNVQMSNTATETGVGVGGMSVDAWDQYSKNRTKGRLENNQLYAQTYTHVEYPVQVAIEKRLVINALDNLINKTIQKVGISATQKMENDAVSLLNNAFSASHTWSDGVALCSASHPVGPNAGSSVYSNRATTAFSKDALSAARIAMSKFKDDRNNLIGLVADEIWCPEELYDEVLEVVQSRQDPTSGNNAINPQATARNWTVYPWLRLSDTNNWWVSNSTMRRMGVNWYIREMTTPMLIEENTTEYVWEFKLHYSYGVDDWRWCYGHEVSGS